MWNYIPRFYLVFSKTSPLFSFTLLSLLSFNIHALHNQSENKDGTVEQPSMCPMPKTCRNVAHIVDMLGVSVVHLNTIINCISQRWYKALHHRILTQIKSRVKTTVQHLGCHIPYFSAAGWFLDCSRLLTALHLYGRTSRMSACGVWRQCRVWGQERSTKLLLPRRLCSPGRRLYQT